jgi:hypothetical protein
MLGNSFPLVLIDLGGIGGAASLECLGTAWKSMGRMKRFSFPSFPSANYLAKALPVATSGGTGAVPETGDPAACWQAAVDAEAQKMVVFAEGSPLGMILDVLEEHPDLKIRIVDLLTARMESPWEGGGDGGEGESP